VSIFAKDTLPKKIAEYMDAACAERELRDVHDLDPEVFETLYTKAFIDTNLDCHQQEFDDTLSGTTAITIFVRNKFLHVANVGDSRAIICSTSSSDSQKVLAEPLSIDQTPFRKDERERVKLCGARVLTIDMIEGIEPIHENWGTELGKEIDEIGDPPRLWNVTLDKPGTAFTRSIGDGCAEAIGVYAEPEHLVREIMEFDKYVVIASDGVFEFLTSQSVCDMVHSIKEPIDACRKVVRESYNLWLQYEIRTDDITMIALYLQNMKLEEEPAVDSGNMDEIGHESGKVVEGAMARENLKRTKRQTNSVALNAMIEHKPVRRNMSKAKRRIVMDNTRRMSAEVRYEEFDFEKYVSKKTDEDRDRLAELTQANFLFQHLIPEQLQKLYSVFTKVEVKAGDVIIKQGDQGDKFYVVDSGEYEVTVQAEDQTIHVVMVYNQGGSSFGELSLMYGKPRAATVTATSDGVIWALARPAFKAMLIRKISHTNLIRVLKKVEILKQLPVPQLQRLCDVLGERTFEDGVNICNQGEKGDQFFIIGSGEVSCTVSDTKTKAEKETMRLKENDYFGERSLLMDEARQFNVTCVGKTSVFILERASFLEVVGDLHELISRDQEKKNAMRQVQSTTTYRIAKHTIQGVSYDELDFQSWACRYDYGFLGVYVHKRAGSLAFQMYTVKAVSKQKAIDQQLDDQIVQDRDLLALLTRPSTFVPVILASFTDPKCVYSVYKGTVVCQLNQILSSVDDFDESASLFYASCVIMALEFLHDEGIMHRRVTPECVWVTAQGYAQLGDLGCAKEMTGQNQFTMCGDPSYLAPEQVMTRGHTHTVDFWSLGVLIYEMLTGDLPFGDSETPETELYKNISCHTYGGDIFEKCQNFAVISDDAVDIVRKLLHPTGGSRIGAGTKGVDEIKEHPWVAEMKWKDLTQGRIAAPHADQCSKKIQMNGNNELETQFVKESPEVAPDDCPEGLQNF
jgi:CRP-like cAMP-binding protein/serine/threonine protein phosphatase PrpC